MARACTVCAHPRRQEIDARLVAGTPLREISALFRGISEDALFRHRSDHIPAALAKAQDAADVAHADALLAQVRGLQARALAILDAAEQGGQLMAALAAIREARACLELLAKLLGELDERPQLNVILTPQWAQVRAALLVALGPYPDAKTAVAGALVRLEESPRAG
jgi:hypothetical protein